jgi:hypothetical protein
MWQDGPDAILLDRVQALVQTIVQYRNAQNTSDAEELKFSDLKTKVECDHLKWLWFTYCPNCGEKL